MADHDAVSRSERVVQLIKILGTTSTIFTASIGCYGFWLGWHTFNTQQEVDVVMVLISFYMVVFGLIGVMAECKADVFRRLGFLASRFGRGCFYLFISTLALVEGMQISCMGVYNTVACKKMGSQKNRINREGLHFAAGAFGVLVSCLLFASYALVKSGKAGQYRDTDVALKRRLGSGS